ncbi:MAG TPA: hypothetical protein VGM36_09045 [Rhizomicrobium sp.]|jgi:hypothetical protein
MAQVLKFQMQMDESPERRQTAPIALAEEEVGFWPEVSSGITSMRPFAPNPANSLSRVLLEMFCVLAAAGALVAVISLTVPAPFVP